MSESTESGTAFPSSFASALPEKQEPLAGGLYLVATPIGNLGDITLRALDVLRRAEVILCEDTRVGARLLSAFGIPGGGRLKPYQDHNAGKVRPRIIADLAGGKSVALISDAGMPLVSDPGYKLVQEAIAQGGYVTTLPGANAVLAALQLAGLPCEHFVFLGFLPPRRAARRRALEIWKSAPATLAVYETGPRLGACLADLLEVLGDRPAAIVREITKKFEDARRGSLSELAAQIHADGPPKGEIVVLAGPPPESPPGGDGGADSEAGAFIRSALEHMSPRDAAAFAASWLGVSKRSCYDLAVRLAREKGE